MLEMGQSCSSIATASGRKPYSKQSGAQLSPEEEAAVADENAGRPNYDRAAYNRAMQKIKQAQKYAGQRNKTKRGNSKFVATAAGAAGVAGAIACMRTVRGAMRAWLLVQ
jgi:hypothetical protein